MIGTTVSSPRGVMWKPSMTGRSASPVAIRMITDGTLSARHSRSMAKASRRMPEAVRDGGVGRRGLVPGKGRGRAGGDYSSRRCGLWRAWQRVPAWTNRGLRQEPCRQYAVPAIRRSSSPQNPVGQVVEEGLDEFGAQVAIVDVVGVFPDVDAEQGGVAGRRGPAAPILMMSTEPSAFFTSQVQPEPKLPTADAWKPSEFVETGPISCRWLPPGSAGRCAAAIGLSNSRRRWSSTPARHCCRCRQPGPS